MNEDVRVATGGLYRCCVQFIQELTRDATHELVAGDKAVCIHCQAKMELDSSLIWQWVS